MVGDAVGGAVWHSLTSKKLEPPGEPSSGAPPFAINVVVGEGVVVVESVVAMDGGEGGSTGGREHRGTGESTRGNTGGREGVIVNERKYTQRN